MKKFIKILLLSMMSTLCMAQKSHLDSLRTILKNASTDSARFNGLYNISEYFNETNMDSSLYYINRAIAMAKDNQHALDEAGMLLFKGREFLDLGKFPQSLENLQQALNLAENAKNENCWIRFNNYTPHQMRLLIMFLAHLNLSELMGWLNNHDEQLIQLKPAKTLASQIGDKYHLGLANMSLGYAYCDINQLDSALLYSNMAIENFKHVKDKEFLGAVYLNIALTYKKKGNKILALQNFHRAIKIDNEQRKYALLDLESDYRQLSIFYLSEKQKDSSLFYAKKTFAILNSITRKKTLEYAYENLYKSYELLGKKDSAYKYQGLAIVAKDSSFNATTKSLADFQKLSFKAQMRANELEKEKDAIKTRIRTYVLLTAIVLFMAIAITFYQVNLQRQKKNLVLTQQKEELQNALSNLKATQTQLIQSEKMASLGELTAGIAHEIQNPLNFVNNFSEVNKEMIEELEDELKTGNIEDALSIAADIKQNEEKINHHGKRADAIVKGMLEHSRAGSGTKEPTDINKLADEYLRLSYHGLRAKDKTFNAEMVKNFDEKLPLINVIPQDIGRVMLNLFNNAFYAVHQKAKTAGADYNPTVVVETFFLPHLGVGGLKVKDNGTGIPDAIKDKIMQPFFTTKPTGEGTGLGLSLTYDMVVKGHGGKIEVNSKDGEGSEFIVTLMV